MKIKPSTYIRNDYAELSSYCKETAEPIYITKNGEGDLVVMSIDAYENMQGKIKHLEEKSFYLQKFLEGAEYNAAHPETFSKEEVFARIDEIIESKKKEGADNE